MTLLMTNVVVILFAWQCLLLQFMPITNAFSTGAGGCPGGIAAVGGLHLSTDFGRPVNSNTLFNAGISVTINETTLDDNTIVEFPSNENLIISIFGTQIPYLGFLIRVQLPDNEVGADLIQPYNDDVTAQIAEACVSPAQGITHRNNSAKLLTSGIMVFDKPYTNITIDITVVFSNGLPASIFAYSGYSINIIGPAITTNPTVMPSASPSVSATTTSPTIAPSILITNPPTNLPTVVETTRLPTAAKETNPPTNLPTATEITSSPTATPSISLTTKETSSPTNVPTVSVTESPSYSPSNGVSTSVPSTETDEITVKPSSNEPTQIGYLIEPTLNPTSSSIQPTETEEFLPPTSMPTMITPSISDIPTVLTEPPFASIRRPSSVITETPFASVRSPNTNTKPSVSKPSATTLPNKGKKSTRHDKKKKKNDQKDDIRLDVEEKDAKDHDESNNNADNRKTKKNQSKSTKVPKVTKFYTNKKTKTDDNEQQKGEKAVEIRSKLSRIEYDDRRRLATRRRMR